MAEKEYIERGAFLRDLELAPDYWYKGRTIKSILEKQPTADVEEVVRCKDCAYRRVPARCSLWMGTTVENDCFREHGDNFYCAFGTPKERGGEK